MSAPHHASIADIAADWVARLDAGSLGEPEQRALEAWLQADPRHGGAFLQAQAAWFSADEAVMADAASPEAGDSDPGFARTGKVARRLVLGGLAAASVAAVATWRMLASRTAEYSTNLGEIRRVPLADGSVMHMNSSTEVEVAIGAETRSVELRRGEAWFKVAKDTARPFVVRAGTVNARAVGTAFSVRIHDEAVDVLVTEGIVESWSDGNEARPLRLTVGQHARVNAMAAVHYAGSDSTTVDRALAWRDGMIDLSSTPLGEAAAEFNRYNHRQIIIEDPGLAAEEIDGVFRIDDPEGFAQALRSGLDLSVRMEDRDSIRISRRRAGEEPGTGATE